MSASPLYGVLGASLLASLLLGTDLPAQADNPSQPPAIIELSTASSTPKGTGWEVEFSGSAPKLPTGTVMKWSLWWRTYKLEEFQVILGGSKRINEQKTFESLSGFAKDVFLRAEVDFLSQPRDVKEALEKDPDTFNLERNPWSVRFYNQRFNLGPKKEAEIDKEIEKQELAARDFFLESLKNALAKEKLFSKKRSEAQAGKAFQKGGSFDSASWQTFVEEEIRDPLRELQSKMRGEKNTLRMLPEQRDYKYLSDIVNAVALRSYERSRSLYQKLGMSPDPNDFSPRKIDTNCPSSKSDYLSKRTKQLCRSQKIELSEVGG